MGLSTTGGSDNTIATTANTTQYFPYGGPIGQAFTTTEADVQVIHREAGQFKYLSIFINANSVNASTTIRTRVNGNNGNLSVSIPTSTTGVFNDLVNTNSIVAADKVNMQSVPGAGSTGTLNMNSITIGFAATTTTDTVTKLICAVSTNYTTASTSRFNPPHGAQVNSSTEANSKVRQRKTATYKSLSCYVSANARTTTTTLRSRKNGANGSLTLSIGNAATGVFEDSTNSDSVVAGDDYNTAVVTGTGTQTLTMKHIAVSYITSSSNYIGTFIAGNASGRVTNAATTVYLGPTGTLVAASSAAEATIQANIQSRYTVSELTINVTANTVTAASTVKLRVNTADGTLAASVTASTTGMFSDSTNTDKIKAGDKLAIQVATGATGTSMTYTSISSNITLTAIPQTVWIEWEES